MFFDTDEDKVRTDLSEYFQPHFKPDFNLDLLRSNNYICHFFAVRRKIAEKKPVVSVRSTTVRRIMILFSAVRRWRERSYTFRGYCTTGESTVLLRQTTRRANCTRTRREKRAIEGNLLRCGETGTVTLRSDYGFYDVEYQLQGTPLVSILIPNKDQADTLRTCIESIRQKMYVSDVRDSCHRE